MHSPFTVCHCIQIDMKICFHVCFSLSAVCTRRTFCLMVKKEWINRNKSEYHSKMLREKRVNKKNDIEKWANRSYEARINQESICLFSELGIDYEVVFLLDAHWVYWVHWVGASALVINLIRTWNTKQQNVHLLGTWIISRKEYFQTWFEFLIAKYKRCRAKNIPIITEIDNQRNKKPKAMKRKTTQSNIQVVCCQSNWLSSFQFHLFPPFFAQNRIDRDMGRMFCTTAEYHID